MTTSVPYHLDENFQYTGFWARFGATLIDTVLILFIIYPILISMHGFEALATNAFTSGPIDWLLNWVFPVIGIIAFWLYRQATPGKMAISAKIVDAKTGEKPSPQQCIVRYLGYYVSTIPLCLGLLWVAWDPKKQGWHDKLAGTVVISPRKG